jgi:hypothetical protein
MKKNVFGSGSRLWIFVVCSILALGGCASSATPVAYQSAAPPEKLCTLDVIATLAVRNFDGEAVEWTSGMYDTWASVRIPEGSHTFVVDYDRTLPNGRRHYRNGIVVGYDGFKAGHAYEMVAAEGAEAGGFAGLFTNMAGAMRDTVNQALRIGIRDVTNDRQGSFQWLPWNDAKKPGG